MTGPPYRVEFHAKAAAETKGLPAAAFTLLIEALTKVSRDPWGTSLQDQPDLENFRWTRFGDAGFVLFVIDDARHMLRVHGITWTG